MNRESIQKLLDAIPDLPLEAVPTGRIQQVEVLMNDHGEGRHVALVNDMRGEYSRLFIQAPAALRFLLAENAALQTRLDSALEEIAIDNEACAGFD